MNLDFNELFARELDKKIIKEILIMAYRGCNGIFVDDKIISVNMNYRLLNLII
jgi:hypothetical protein